MAKQEPEIKSIIRCAMSTSRPSTFSTTGRSRSRVSVTSLASSTVVGLMTQTSMPETLDRLEGRMGVTFCDFTGRGRFSS